MSDHDLIVLGGGNAVTLAMRAARAGRRVALVERDRLGGTCPNRGCIPSKLLLGYAEVANRIGAARRFHMEAPLTSVDGDRILRETRAATLDVTDAKIADALPEGCELVRGTGRFVGDRTVAVGAAGLRADTVVVATGTRPRVPDIPGLEGTPFLTSDDVFELETMPRSILIQGGGYIACELATFFTAVGVRTTVLVRSDRLLRAEDAEIAGVFTEGFTEHVDVRFETTITGVSHDGAGFAVAVDGPGGAETLSNEALLLAVGRVPNGDIGLDAAGVETDDRGFVIVDSRLRTTAPGVYCLGDLTGRHPFTHAAAWAATYLGDCLLEGRDEDLDYGPMPHAVFAHPEIAGVGATEDDLRSGGVAFRAAALPYSTAAKGRAIKEEHGLCKLLVDPDGAILGCHIVGQDASVLLHEVIPVMKWRNHVSSLTGIIHIHPSLSEVVRNTARKAAGMI